MRLSTLLIIFCFTQLCSYSQADFIETSSAKITFTSEAPLELISAESNEGYGILNLEKNEFAFKVKIRSFEGFNSPLQKEHFNENYLESEEYPEATFTGNILDYINVSQKGTYQVNTKGILTIHNVEDERVIKLYINVSGDGTIAFSAEFEVELIEHNIDVPRIVYQKISEVINVNVKGVLN